MRASLLCRAAVLAALVLLTGCGGGGSGGRSPQPPPPPPPPPPPVNVAPTISGTPATSLFAGEHYEFVPVADDANGDSLSFDIDDPPPWVSFDSATGTIEGDPGIGDIGTFADIVISVSDGEFSVSLPPFTIRVERPSPLPAQSGLDERPANLTCRAVAPPAPPGARVSRVFPNLSLSNLTDLAQSPDGAWYFARRDGLIGRFANSANVSSFTTVLDHRSKVSVVPDGGLIAIAFHPAYPSDRRIFANYSAPPSTGGSTADVLIVSFDLSADGRSINPQSEKIIFRYARGAYHQGGFLGFDRDGYLLAAFGDGTDQGDPTGRAQDLGDFRGTMIRLDVDGPAPYAIPADNPFAGSDGIPDEIYAYGFRNPWRGDVDPDTGRIYVGDVGYLVREEVTEVFAGANHGWNVKEGSSCFSEAYGSCADPDLIVPLVEYNHVNGRCAVMGGHFYRGSAIPQLRGRFVFADYCTSAISAVSLDNDGEPFELPLVPAGSGLGRIISFARDNAGELYAVTPTTIHKILPSGSGGPAGPPALLSQTGCFDSNDPTIPAAGLIPYDLKSALWSDAAEKRRWIAIPDGTSISLAADGDFLFPAGTVLIKEFSFDGQPVETRLLMRDNSGGWEGYSYEWVGNDAQLLTGAKETTLANGLPWHFPSRGECSRCHTAEANFSLGPEIAQLNGLKVYAETDRISNQLATMAHIGLLANGLPAPPDQLPAMAGLSEQHQALSRRARSYLHSNCSGCHRGEGATQSTMDLRFQKTRADMVVCNAQPVFSSLGIADARVLAPGDPDRSILLQRPSSLNPVYRMPPLGTSIIHDEAMETLRTWIRSATVCAAESDTDGDSVPDDADNCPSAANPDQADGNRDGVGDACTANP